MPVVSESFLSDWTSRLRAEYPEAQAILLQGSYARGEQEARSDLDLTVLVPNAPAIAYRSVIQARPRGPLLHATIQCCLLAEWLEQFEEPGESEEWAYFLPALLVTRALWVSPAVRAQFPDPLSRELEVSPQLQDLLEGVAKARNARERGDRLALRQAAQTTAVRCPAVLSLLNPPVCVRSPIEALRVALAMPLTPPHYDEDLLVCLGLSDVATQDEDVWPRLQRLALAVLSLLRPHASDLSAWFEPDLGRYLADGTLERLVTEP